MYMGTNSTSYYFSVANGNISRFFDEMYLNTPWDYHYENLDSRTILDRLAAVKYFVVKAGEEEYLPYGYDTLAAEAFLMDMIRKLLLQRSTGSTKMRMRFLWAIRMIPGSQGKNMKNFL